MIGPRQAGGEELPAASAYQQLCATMRQGQCGKIPGQHRQVLGTVLNQPIKVISGRSVRQRDPASRDQVGVEAYDSDGVV
jgi:hypothetical protein